ncbi:dioxygenase [Actinomadura barringtoniae]|uniref:Dioxygenase n=1 Tax=Actinomadura barringtoniae TaxID=1427535 RepID=A0A939P609_9ACTN|nr:dioxygenase [Actinomadura barringtoniae]MBO2446036.1 dioxygenase [Actinomadura barringtoniae]
MLDDEQNDGISRKNFIMTVGLGALALPAAMGAARADAKEAPARPLKLTPRCDDGDDPTPPQTEGPYFKPNSPQRTSLLEPGMVGTRLTLTGIVYTRSCNPVNAALLDFWQCDAYGRYDNYGYRLRGHQYSDATGRFSLTTIRPGLYPGRTRHIHVKLQAPNQPVLTTQLYFPGEPRNQTDPIFDPDLVMAVQNGPTGLTATFDFMLDLP